MNKKGSTETDAAQKDRSADRHSKESRSVRFGPELYQAMERLAVDSDRPTSWEFRRAVELYLALRGKPELFKKVVKDLDFRHTED